MTPQQRYYRKNRERLLKDAKERYVRNIEKERKRSKEYKTNNKDQIKSRRNEAMKIKRKSCVSFKLRSNISRSIRKALKNNGGKRGLSCLHSINYNINDLKSHLEKQFESWMNWDNYGIYSQKTWDDNNMSTWTWQVDHIIPQSSLLYTSMDDDNFKKCWALSNLRPLSSKENFLKGNK